VNVILLERILAKPNFQKVGIKDSLFLAFFKKNPSIVFTDLDKNGPFLDFRNLS